MASPSIVDFQTRSREVSNTSNSAAARAFKRRQIRVSRAQVNAFRAQVVQPRAQELAYMRILRRFVSRWNAIVLRELEPILEGIAEPPPPPPGGIRFDANSAVDAVLERLQILSIEEFEEEEPEFTVKEAQELQGEEDPEEEKKKKLTPEEEVKKVGDQVSSANARQQKRVLGIDFKTELVSPETLAAFRRTNVALIKSIPQQQLTKLQALLDEAPTLQVKALRAKIQQLFKVTKSRADLIARDQVLKLNSQLTKDRQQRVGITEYIWITSRDERVRDAHSELDGTRQRWDTPPVSSDDGRTNHPGEDYQCRCTASPVIPALDL